MNARQKATWRAVNTRLVTETFTDEPLDKCVYHLLNTYYAGNHVQILGANNFPNPTVCASFTRLSLHAALERLCDLADIQVEVPEDGVLQLRSRTVEEQLKRALHVEKLLKRARSK